MGNSGQKDRFALAMMLWKPYLDALRTPCDDKQNAPPPPTNQSRLSGSRLETKVLRMAWYRTLARRSFWLVCTAFVLAGCQEQEPIREYTVPKEPPVRLLAVMAPREDSTWFFKLMGPAPEVAKHVQAFDAFVASIRFPEPGKIEWAVPGEWSEEHSDKRFAAVIRFAGKGMPLPITITQLRGPRAKNVRANLDRWRGQLGLTEIDDESLEKLEGNIKVDGVAATRVDFIGPGAGKGVRRAQSAPGDTHE